MAMKLKFVVLTVAKKLEKKLPHILPLVSIRKLYENKVNYLLSSKKYKNWDKYKWIKFPKIGTSIQLMLCKNSEEPPFLTKTKCMTIGKVIWKKNSFRLKTVNSDELSNEEF